MSCYVFIQSEDKLQTKGPKSELSCCGIPDEARLKVTKRVQEAKKRSREEENCIGTLYNDAMVDLYDKGYGFVAEIPIPQTLKRPVLRNRYKSQGKTKEPDMYQNQRKYNF